MGVSCVNENLRYGKASISNAEEHSMLRLQSMEGDGQESALQLASHTGPQNVKRETLCELID